VRCSVLQCVAVCCSVLQCVAVCCSVLQCVAVCCSVTRLVKMCDVPPNCLHYSMLQCADMCCNVMRCVAVCCSVLQCVAVCWGVLQCVVVCCSVLQCVAVWQGSLTCVTCLQIDCVCCILKHDLQGGKDPQDALSCGSLSSYQPLIIGLFCGKWPTKIGHPMSLCHPVSCGLMKCMSLRTRHVSQMKILSNGLSFVTHMWLMNH